MYYLTFRWLQSKLWMFSAQWLKLQAVSCSVESLKMPFRPWPSSWLSRPQWALKQAQSILSPRYSSCNWPCWGAWVNFADSWRSVTQTLVMWCGCVASISAVDNLRNYSRLVRCNMPNVRKECIIPFQNTERWVEKTKCCQRVFFHQL